MLLTLVELGHAICAVDVLAEHCPGTGRQEAELDALYGKLVDAEARLKAANARRAKGRSKSQ